MIVVSFTCAIGEGLRVPSLRERAVLRAYLRWCCAQVPGVCVPGRVGDMGAVGRGLHCVLDMGVARLLYARPMRTFLAVALATMLLVGSAARAAQIGESVESKVPIESRVNVPNNLPVAVTQIALDDGVWLVSGLVDFFVFGLSTNAYVGAAIDTSITISADGTGLFTTVGGPPPLSFGFPGLALPGKTITIDGNNVPLYLVGWSLRGPTQPLSQAQAWGFITAVKIRNHAP